MAAIDACIFCEQVHRGLCADQRPAKTPPKKRAPKQPTPSQSESPALLDHVVKLEAPGPAPATESVFESAVPTALDRWAGVAARDTDPLQAALNALAPILHVNELEKYNLRRPMQGSLAARVAQWKEGRRGT